MLDTSISMTHRLNDLYAGAEQFPLRLLPHDKATVGAFNDKIEFASGFTNDRGSLASALKHLDFGNETRLYDAVYASLDQLEKLEGRKVILLFTDGADFGSRQGSGRALERSRDGEVMIYRHRARNRVLQRAEPCEEQARLHPESLRERNRRAATSI